MSRPASSLQKQTSFGPVYVGEYRLAKTLGKGAYASVKVGIQDAKKEKVAIKIIDKEQLNKDSSLESRIKKELEILQALKHKNIVEAKGYSEDDQNVYLVQELCQNGDLFALISQSFSHLSEEQARVFFHQILQALSYAHSRGVAHRDLKPENILIDSENNLKLADFGLSSFIEDGKSLATSCGSPNYLAPEVLSGLLYDGCSADMWSAGVILYAMLQGQLPFSNDHIGSLIKQIKACDFEFPEPISQEAQDLVNRLVQPNPLKRLSAKQALNHPWLTSLNYTRSKGKLGFFNIGATSSSQRHRLEKLRNNWKKPTIKTGQEMENRRMVRTNSDFSTEYSVSERDDRSGLAFDFQDISIPDLNKPEMISNQKYQNQTLQITNGKEKGVNHLLSLLGKNNCVWKFDKEPQRFLFTTKQSEESAQFSLQLFKEKNKKAGVHVLVKKDDTSLPTQSFLDQYQELYGQLSSMNL